MTKLSKKSKLRHFPGKMNVCIAFYVHKSKLRHFQWFLGKMNTCIAFYVHFSITFLTSLKRSSEVWDFRFSSNFLVVSRYSLTLNVLISVVSGSRFSISAFLWLYLADLADPPTGLV